MISPEDYWWDRWFAAAGVEGAEHRPRTAGLRLDSQADEGHAAMGGRGFVLLTPAFWRNDIKDGRLCMPFDLTATAGFRYWLAIAPERQIGAQGEVVPRMAARGGRGEQERQRGGLTRTCWSERSEDACPKCLGFASAGNWPRGGASMNPG